MTEKCISLRVLSSPVNYTESEVMKQSPSVLFRLLSSYLIATLQSLSDFGKRFGVPQKMVENLYPDKALDYPKILDKATAKVGFFLQ